MIPLGHPYDRPSTTGKSCRTINQKDQRRRDARAAGCPSPKITIAEGFPGNTMMIRANSGLQRLVIGVVAMAVVSNRGMADDRVDPIVNEMLAAHNLIRKQRKLAPFVLSPELCKAAEIHARDMANHERMSHTGSDGSNPIQRAKRVGYGSSRVGENVAVSQWTVEQVMMEWMESRGHRGNIVGNYTELGAARIVDELGNNFWCVNFGDPRPAIARRAPDQAASTGAFGKRTNDEAAAALVAQINRQREAARMVLLKPEARLGRAAITLSAAMAATDSREVETDPKKLFGENALQGRKVCLRLATNVQTAQQAAEAILGHDADQLESFREIGVGYAVAKSGTRYWCAIFAKSAGSKGRESPE
jgi:uncharacterized protein YkwD